MKSTLLVKTLGASLVLLLLVGGLGYVSVNHLKRNARLIVEDTLPGLAYAGAANAYLADASRTLLLLISESPTRREELRQEIAALSKRTTGFLDQYDHQISEAEDKTNFADLLDARQHYIGIREEVISLAVAGKRDEALLKYNQDLLPAHVRVKKAGDKLLQYNMQVGEKRGQDILSSCTSTQIAVAVGSVAVFLIGFFIGLFK